MGNGKEAQRWPLMTVFVQSVVLPALWSLTLVPSVSPVWSVPGHSSGGNSMTRLYSSTGLWSGRIRKRKMIFFSTWERTKTMIAIKNTSLIFYSIAWNTSSNKILKRLWWQSDETHVLPPPTNFPKGKCSCIIFKKMKNKTANVKTWNKSMIQVVFF